MLLHDLTSIFFYLTVFKHMSPTGKCSISIEKFCKAASRGCDVSMIGKCNFRATLHENMCNSVRTFRIFQKYNIIEKNLQHNITECNNQFEIFHNNFLFNYILNTRY